MNEHEAYEQGLVEMINSKITVSPYCLEAFEYSAECFGNVIVVLKTRNSNNRMRFIRDKGDIFIQKMIGGKWQDVDAYMHTDKETHDGLLIKAIVDYTE